MKPDLKFDREYHIYSRGDVVIPSVTQILKDQGILTISTFSTGSTWRG